MAGWNAESSDTYVPDRGNFLRNRPPILPSINATDYRPPRTSPNEPDNQYSAYINQQRVNQYTRNINESNISNNYNKNNPKYIW